MKFDALYFFLALFIGFLVVYVIKDNPIVVKHKYMKEA